MFKGCTTNENHITIELDKRSNKKYRDSDVILEYIELLVADDEQYDFLLKENSLEL